MRYLVCAAALLAACGASYSATVTLDATAKSAASDVSTLEPKWVQAKGEQIGLYIQSSTLNPQKLTLKMQGLKAGRYDVYVNWGEFRIKHDRDMAKKTGGPDNTATIEPGYVIRDKDAAELAGGIALETPGRVVPLARMRCIESAAPKLANACKGLAGLTAEEPVRARWTLEQASGWVRSVANLEETYRSVRVFVAPAGATPEEIDWRTMMTKNGLLDAAVNTCANLQVARAKMSRVLVDPLIRGFTVDALTPVETRTRYTRSQKGIPTLAVEITNNCDLAISGAVNVLPPEGWKATAKKPSFAKLASGAVYKESFTLNRTAKGKPVPGKLTVKATIKVTSPEGTAVLDVTRYAELEK